MYCTVLYRQYQGRYYILPNLERLGEGYLCLKQRHYWAEYKTVAIISTEYCLKQFCFPPPSTHESFEALFKEKKKLNNLVGKL